MQAEKKYVQVDKTTVANYNYHIKFRNELYYAAMLADLMEEIK